LNHLVWRLHRNQVYFALGSFVALALLLIVTGTVMRDDYTSALTSCTQAHSCGDLASLLFRGDGSIVDLVNATVVIPLLFGLFWGSPLLSKEFEDGTHNLAWTQAISRRRWLRANIGWSLVAAAAWGAALTALVSYWRFPEKALGSRFASFDIQGIVPVAYALFAVALGIAVGSVIRRVLPSLATTLAVFVALRVTIGVYLRPHYMAPITKLVPLVGSGGPPTSAWTLSTSFVNGHGHALGDSLGINALPVQCRTAVLGGKDLGGQCLSNHGFHQLVTYQPDSRFWAFQGVEAGIFFALTVVLVGFAWWWVLRRDA
jgi:hypothetical protein